MTDELKQWEYDKGYTKGYSDGRASLIEELEKIKAELNLKIEYLIDIAKVDYINGIEETIDILDKHISELKGEQEWHLL